MEENIKRQQSELKKNYKSMFKDKIISIKNNFRCKSPNNQRILSFNLNIKNNKLFDNFLKKKKNSDYILRILSSKTRNILNKNERRIKLSTDLKSNESRINIDSTKPSSKRTGFNTSFSFLKLTNSSQVENISHLKIDTNLKRKKLKGQEMKSSTKKLIYEKFKSKLNESNSRNNYDSEYNHNINSYNGFSTKYLVNEDDYKNNNENMIQSYPIKYSYMTNIMNNILHTVNFVNIENKEELYQDVINKIENKDNMSVEDFRLIGQELNPEELYKIIQNKKQNLIKKKYEELKKNYILANIENIKKNNLLRTKRKNYIPEYKLTFKKESWRNKNYESIYKYKPDSFSLDLKKRTSNLKKEFINFNIKKLEQNNSGFLSQKRKNFEKTKKSKIKISEDFFGKDNIKIRKSNYANKTFKTNKVINKKQKFKINLQEDNINLEKKAFKKPIFENNDENKIIENNDDNLVLNINDINLINSNNKIIDISDISPTNFEDKKKDYNKDNQIERTDTIFIKENKNYEFELLDIYDYVNSIKTKKKYKRRHSFNFVGENDIILSTKNKRKKTKIISDEKNISKFIMFKNPSLNFAIKLLNKTKNENYHEKIKPKVKEITKVKNNNYTKNEITKENKGFKEYLIQKQKIELDKLNRNKIFSQIDKCNSNKKKTYKPFYEFLKEFQRVNKIELNFISLNKNSSIKYTNNKRKQRKYNKTEFNKAQMIKNQLNKSEEKQDESMKDIGERLSIMKKRRLTDKSILLGKINSKYKEIEEKRNIDVIKEKLIEKLNKKKLFENVNLKSFNDIEENIAIVLYKLKEDIKYKISIGKCEKSEMDEIFKLEKKLDEFKLNYKLKDKNIINKYILFLLMNLNEFIELLELREMKKMKENRINKFLNNLEDELYYKIPWSLDIKGRRCSAKEFNGNISSLSDIKN